MQEVMPSNLKYGLLFLYISHKGQQTRSQPPEQPKKVQISVVCSTRNMASRKPAKSTTVSRTLLQPGLLQPVSHLPCVRTEKEHIVIMAEDETNFVIFEITKYNA